MAKLYFYYAAMNAGKSTTLLQAAFNYVALCRRHFFERLREGEARQLSLGLARR